MPGPGDARPSKPILASGDRPRAPAAAHQHGTDQSKRYDEPERTASPHGVAQRGGWNLHSAVIFSASPDISAGRVIGPGAGVSCAMWTWRGVRANKNGSPDVSVGRVRGRGVVAGYAVGHRPSAPSGGSRADGRGGPVGRWLSRRVERLALGRKPGLWLERGVRYLDSCRPPRWGQGVPTDGGSRRTGGLDGRGGSRRTGGLDGRGVPGHGMVSLMSDF